MNAHEIQATSQPSIQDQLIELSLEGLKNMYDTKSGLFCFRVIRRDVGLVKEGTSLRYSLIILLGLDQCKRNGIKIAFDLDELFSTVWSHSKEISGIGDYGLLVWVCSRLSPQKLPDLTNRTALNNVLIRYEDARENRTMEMAWFLIGLCYAAHKHTQDYGALRQLARSTYNLMLRNYGGNGIFGHKNKKSLSGILRGRIGTFADQVYPIYALCKYSQVYGDKEALKIALECGKTICKHQGNLGQWWWHYDSVTGNVVGRYPVYAVHQDSMAPMALFAISNATGHDFSNSIYKGLKWLYKSNELKQNMIDIEKNLIWRCLFRKMYTTYLEELFSLIKPGTGKNSPNDLNIRWECRPYHLGWILYTFGGQAVRD